MASASASSSIFAVAVVLSLLLPAARGQSAPAPAPAGPPNITGILEKAGGYSFFIGLLTNSHTDDQINNQVNNSRDGMTVFAPTDNAFNNLPSGYLNNLSTQQQIQLIQYHICPKYYSMEDFRSVSNPVRTQASGQDNKVFGLFITAQSNQINVSTGLVSVSVYNAVRKDFPLSVYQLDNVLTPKEFSEAAAAPAPSPPKSTSSSTNSTSRSAAGGDNAAAPSTESSKNGSGRMNVGLLSVICLFCLGLLA